jgi:hypothetical protein
MSKTLLEILSEVKDDLELSNEEAYGDRSLDPMISDTELKRYVNNSLEEITALTHAMYEDYFMTYKTYTLTEGVSTYVLPTDIHLKKIRRVIYHDEVDPFYGNGQQRKVQRITNIDDTTGWENSNSSTEAYMLVDESDIMSGLYTNYIKLFPKANGKYMTVWYYRELPAVSADTDVIEALFTRYLVADVIYKCLIKDVGNPMTQYIATNRKELKELMIQSLSNKVPDDQTDIIPDMSFYDMAL